LVQTRGFNGFSYGDIADALRLTKASLHYHFSTKAKLGERLIERYAEQQFESAAAEVVARRRDPYSLVQGWLRDPAG